MGALEDIEKWKNQMITVKIRSQGHFKEDFILTTDASVKAIGAILSQSDSSNRKKMKHTFSENLGGSKFNYSIIDKELLSAVEGMNHFIH